MRQRVSKILDEYGKPIVVEQRPKSQYDLARTTDENKKHFRQADFLSARYANSPGIRRTLRSRSRYERDNDPYYAGLVRTIPTDMFGTGPRLQCLLEDQDDLNSSIESKFMEWVDATNFVGDLLVAGETKIVDGEPFGIIRAAEVDHPVGLLVQWVESEQCTTPANGIPKNEKNWVDGIDLDDLGRPLTYHFLREHPNDMVAGTGIGIGTDGLVGVGMPADYERVPADIVLHWFRRGRAGQYRGIPECVSSVGLGAQRRRWSMATLTAAEIAANFAVLVTSNLPPGYTEESLPEPFETLAIERGMITTLPAGGDAHQMKSEHPSAEYSPFKHEMLKEMGRPVGAPYSVTGMDGSEHNYSSLRYERELYHSALTVERDGCRRAVLDRVFRAWYTIARMIPGYLSSMPGELPESIPFGWYWPGFAAIDPVKEAVADTERLENGTTTLKEVYASYGQDHIVQLKQRAREINLMKELGIPLPKWADPAAGTTPSPNAQQRSADQSTARILAIREETA